MERQHKALGSKHRYKMASIINQGPITVGDLHKQVKSLKQPGVSQHLAILSKARLVSRKQEGNKVIYSPTRLLKDILKSDLRIAKNVI